MIHIRRASALDAGLLASMGERTFSDTFGADNTPEDMAAYLKSSFGEEKQAAELADPLTTFFVAEIDGAPAGYAVIRAGVPAGCVTGARPIELARLYACRESIGRGVGPALLETCLEEARNTGYLTMWLGVWERNERAKSFYLKWGFRFGVSTCFSSAPTLRPISSWSVRWPESGPVQRARDFSPPISTCG